MRARYRPWLDKCGETLKLLAGQVDSTVYDSPRVPVELKCPFCDHRYEFRRGEISLCPSCDLVITLSPDEPAPRIECSRKRAWFTTSLLPTGLVCLFLFPPYGAVVGFPLLMTFFGLAASLATRCSNCGAALQHPHAKWCSTCGATLENRVA